MRVFKPHVSLVRQFFLLMFNGGAMRKTYAHRLFSCELCLSCLLANNRRNLLFSSSS
jgi:hypothetical protein